MRPTPDRALRRQTGIPDRLTGPAGLFPRGMDAVRGRNEEFQESAQGALRRMPVGGSLTADPDAKASAAPTGANPTEMQYWTDWTGFSPKSTYFH